MAKADVKERPQQEAKAEKKQPLYILRAKQPQTPQQFRDKVQYWTTIGAVWPASWTDKETGEVVDGLSIRINNQPTGWNGDCMAMPPKDRE